MRAILVVAFVLPDVVATTVALFVVLSPSSSLDEPPDPDPRRTQTQVGLGWRRLSFSFWGTSPWPYNTNNDDDGNRGYYRYSSHYDRDGAGPAYDEDGIGKTAATDAAVADEYVQDYRHYHRDMENIVANGDASDAPPLDPIATSLPDTSRHLATSSDRHHVAVWSHKDIYDPLIYSYDNHTFTAQTNTRKDSGQVGQWRHIRGATKPDGTETIIVGISKDNNKVRGMLLREESDGGATKNKWYQVVPGTSTESTAVLATLESNEYAAVDVQYESNSEEALLVWST